LSHGKRREGIGERKNEKNEESVGKGTTDRKIG